MMQAIGRALATALLAAVAGAVCAVVLYAWHPALRIEGDRALPGNVQGFYPPERAEPIQLTFAWTRGDARITLPGLDRRVPWLLTLRARGGRVADADNPDVTILADDVGIATKHTHPQFDEFTATIPALPNGRGLVLGLRSSKTFVPGKTDPRTLGIMVDRLTLVPAGAVLLPQRAIGATALSSAEMGAAIALLGVTAGSAIGGAILVSAADAAIVARGLGPFSAYPDRVVALGCEVAVALALVALAFRFTRAQSLRNTARFAIAFTASVLFLKLLVLLHPDMPMAATRLRIMLLSADAIVAVLLYPAIVAAWGDRLAGAMAVALYQLIPLDLVVVAAGKLTNGAGMATVVLAATLAMASLGAFGAATAWRHGPAWRTIAIVLLSATVITFVHRWWGVLA